MEKYLAYIWSLVIWLIGYVMEPMPFVYQHLYWNDWIIEYRIDNWKTNYCQLELTFVTDAPPPPECPPNFEPVRGIGCLLISKEAKLTWYEAVKWCDKQGGELLEIETSVENDIVKDKLGEAGTYVRIVNFY